MIIAHFQSPCYSVSFMVAERFSFTFVQYLELWRDAIERVLFKNYEICIIRVLRFKLCAPKRYVEVLTPNSQNVT